MTNKTQISRHRFAYVLYATDTPYGNAALVTLRFLKNLTARDDLDFVVLHPGLPRYLLNSIEEMGAISVKVNRLPYTSNSKPYFKDCLIKLRILQLTQYDRIVFMDVDSLLLKSLDYLFVLPFSEPLAAPRAYWLPQPWATSMLLVVKPSPSSWDRVAHYFQTAFKNQHYDMDIINLAFKDEIHFLPNEIACLNSEWENRDKSFRFSDPQKTLNTVQIVHFSGLGKPWYFHPKSIRWLQPRAYEAYYHFWQTWWSVRDDIFLESLPMAKLKHTLLKYWSLIKSITLFSHFRKKSM